MTKDLYRTIPWHIIQQPDGTTDPALVRFVKYKANGKALDQIARWTRRGWDPQRWLPTRVPAAVLQSVETQMLTWGDKQSWQ
jgi:hypothetical protein